jgi:hypothetical protein
VTSNREARPKATGALDSALTASPSTVVIGEMLEAATKTRKALYRMRNG